MANLEIAPVEREEDEDKKENFVDLDVAPHRHRAGLPVWSADWSVDCRLQSLTIQTVQLSEITITITSKILAEHCSKPQ